MKKAPTGKEIFRRIARGDEQVFEQLFRSQYARLVVFAMRFIPDRMEAENIVQMVFIKLWEKRKELKIESLNAYLMMVVRNQCLNELRRFRNHLSVDDLFQLPIIDDHEAERDEELLEKIYTTINAMPPQRQKIFKMSRLEGMKYKEIAETLGISHKTVEAQMGKALKTLREAFKPTTKLLDRE
ncbi:RNA polymerase sigma-70 factor [Thermophagus sp. OGC60D27]|uniref:RNA polymerase sigma-70 factor n=1 Tax=Thermophagus sp. OGC60D27 TaxID=3458415 RepID=UPI004037E616